MIDVLCDITRFTKANYQFWQQKKKRYLLLLISKQERIKEKAEMMGGFVLVDKSPLLYVT